MKKYSFARFVQISLVFFAANAWCDARLLKQNETVFVITLKEAFALALTNHSKLLIAHNYWQRRRAENIMRIGAILPKLRLASAYTRNIPEIEAKNLGSNTQSLSRQVAGLLRKDGNNDAANQLEREADLMSRPSPKILLSPKDVFDAKLTLEVPLFNGPDLARLFASGESVLVQEARVRDEEGKTLFATAKTYFSALHLRNILVLREQAENAALERYQKATAQRKRGVVMEKDFLHAHANFLYKQAERNASLLEYRSTIAELGLMLGQDKEFQISDPEETLFEPLNDDTEKLIEVALRHRADLRAERQNLRVVENERFGQFLQFLPTFTLQGDAKYTSNEKSLTGKNFTYAISVNMGFSIFEGGIGIAQLRDTNLKRQESQIKIGEIHREIDTRIRGRKEKLNQLIMLERASEVMTKAAIESEHVASARHRRGMIDLQEFFEFADKRLNAEIAYKKAQTDLNEERLALIYDVGLLTPSFLR